MELLAPELLAHIVGFCDPQSRTSVRRVCRRFVTAVDDCEGICYARLGIPVEMLMDVCQRRRRVAMHVAGDTREWCAVASSLTCRSVAIAISATPAPRWWVSNSVARHAYCMLPMQLTRLELHFNAPIGQFALNSLCSSLPFARSLSAVFIRNVPVQDLCHILNALAMRKRHPFNTPLVVFEAAVGTIQASGSAPETVDISGLSDVSEFHCRVEPVCTNQDQEVTREISDQFSALAKGPMRAYTYTGPPLHDPLSWASLIHRSAHTLEQITVPMFNDENYAPEIEFAVDGLHRVRDLRVMWPYAKIDYMLRNKSNLEILVHWGKVENWETLLAQLCAMVCVTEFYLAVTPPRDFFGEFERQVRWPKCHALRMGPITIG